MMATFRKFPRVRIIEVDGEKITFEIDSKLATATNDKPDGHHVPGVFTTTKDKLWMPVEGTVVSGQPVELSVPLEKDKEGPLYWEDTETQNPGEYQGSKCYARGAVKPFLKDESEYRAKWPDEAGGVGGTGVGFWLDEPTETDFEIEALRLHIDGLEDGLDLLNTSLVPPQTLTLGGGTLTLEVTEAGAKLVGAQWSKDVPTIRVVAAAILVEGKPLNDPDAVVSTLDLLNSHKAFAVQNIVLRTAIFTTKLRLYDAGFYHFNAEPFAKKTITVIEAAMADPVQLAALRQIWRFARSVPVGDAERLLVEGPRSDLTNAIRHLSE